MKKQDTTRILNNPLNIKPNPVSKLIFKGTIKVLKSQGPMTNINNNNIIIVITKDAIMPPFSPEDLSEDNSYTNKNIVAN